MNSPSDHRLIYRLLLGYRWVRLLRIKLLHGVFKIDNNLAKGTHVIATVPLEIKLSGQFNPVGAGYRPN